MTKVILEGLIDVGKRLEDLEAERAGLWARFFAIADREAGPGEPYRYLDEDLLQVIARVIPMAQEVLDEAALLEDPGLTAAMKKHVTRPAVDREKLGAALELGIVPAELVARHVTVKAAAPRRYGPAAATKEERASGRVKGEERRVKVVGRPGRGRVAA